LMQKCKSDGFFVALKLKIPKLKPPCTAVKLCGGFAYIYTVDSLINAIEASTISKIRSICAGEREEIASEKRCTATAFESVALLSRNNSAR